MTMHCMTATRTFWHAAAAVQSVIQSIPNILRSRRIQSAKLGLA